jgi:hypothetical protein
MANGPDYAGFPRGVLADIFDGMVAEVLATWPVDAPADDELPEPMLGEMGRAQ